MLEELLCNLTFIWWSNKKNTTKLGTCTYTSHTCVNCRTSTNENTPAQLLPASLWSRTSAEAFKAVIINYAYLMLKNCIVGLMPRWHSLVRWVFVAPFQFFFPRHYWTTVHLPIYPPAHLTSINVLHRNTFSKCCSSLMERKTRVNSGMKHYLVSKGWSEVIPLFSL